MDKIIVTTGAKCATDVNEHLRAGWQVKEIVAEHVAIAGAGKSATGDSYGTSGEFKFKDTRGHIIVVLTIDDEKHDGLSSKFANV